MSNSSFYSNTGITSADVSSITSSKEAAATSETNAATSATNAATSATQAATSATNAATSETNAATSATNAATSASSVGTSETNASASAATATTQASNAATSATAAAGSASAANTSKTNAASSETNAATSATNAATSATSAATSATSAGTSATNAGTSETNAAASSSSASGYVTSATTQANNAATSATAAATSETNAAASATAASTSASGASTSASNANTSATNAASSASQAAASAASAALAADNFDDTYLGSNASDPTTDNDGDALNAGDLHFNTSSNTLKVYNGSAWQDAAVDSSGFVQTTGDTMTGALDVQSTITADELDLNALAATISDTAVDIFVYDTRKDSCGGAWRKRTQHTSWYNETLNTATRGSRKEFPAVAVIVAEADTVTIYDGDDPSLPLWKELNPYASTTTSVTASNGHIVVGNDSGSNNTASGGVWDFRFIEDISFHWAATGSSNLGYNSGISSSAQTVPVEVKYSGEGLVHNDVDDVAMTVLPNAPIDAATGLPVPTIAVATNGGLSVIKDDGTVVDTTSTDVFNGVSFTKSQYGADLYAVNTTFADDPQWFPNVGGLSDGFTFTKNFYARTPSYEKLSSDILSRQSGNVFALIAEHTFAVGMGTSGGINLDPALNLVQHSTTLDDSGLVAFINDDHNTGWQNGDIKLATLSDTDDTDVTGSELVTNGTFDSDTSGWTATNATLSVDAGRLKIVDNGSSAAATQTISVTAGETYVITFDATAGTTTCQAYVSDGTFTVIGSNIPDGAFSYTYTAPSGVSSFDLGLNNSNGITGQYCFFDNVSVRLAEEDRSVNNNGLQVFGTVTKNPVATGADLVAYSGFSSSNYLVQPYNSDLDFGTDDFCIMYWVKTSDLYYTVVDRNDGEGFGLYTAGTSPNSRLRLIIGSTTIDSADTTILTTDTWTQVVVLRRSSTNIEYYINGTLFDTDTISSSLSASSPSELPARVGVRGDGAQHLTGSLALLRISATAPSPEQIKKIYEDEKFLFQENAQATLYGSSDAVTALAYDNTTELLHVGTSAGRSVFQGLRRVENTTDAVGAAISANNGLVAED